MPPGFRDLYDPAGPEGYYRAHGESYRNPHEAAVAAALAHAVSHWGGPEGIGFARILDLAAGSGEATLALTSLLPEAHLEAIDPFTQDLYQRRTGRPCQPHTFEQIARGGAVLSDYSCIVCSCALHLVEESWLPALCLVLATRAADLLVLTPLTRPAIRPAWGWQLREATSVTRDERTVRLRWYRSTLRS